MTVNVLWRIGHEERERGKLKRRLRPLKKLLMLPPPPPPMVVLVVVRPRIRI